MKKLLLSILLLLCLTGIGPREVYRVTEQDIYATKPTLWLDSADLDSYNRENLTTYSEQFDNAAWTKNNCTVSADQAASPYTGAVVMDKLVEDATAATQHYLTKSYTAVAGQETKFQLVAKAAEDSWLRLYSDDTVTNRYAYYNLSTCAVGTTHPSLTITSADSIGNGWCEISFTWTLTGSGASTIQVMLAEGDGDVTIDGDGSSGVLIGHYQLRRTSTSSKYVPTTTAAVNGVSSTRAVSRWYSKVGSISFANATAAQQPVRTLPTNNENRVLYSDDISNTGWTRARATAISATELKEDSTASATHVTLATTSAIAGQVYNLTGKVKRGTGTRNVLWLINWSGGTSWAYFDLSDCTLNSTTGTTATWLNSGPSVSNDDGWCFLNGSVTAPGTGTVQIQYYMSTDLHVTSYNGDNTSTIHIANTTFNHQNANSYYQPTTDHALYRGSKGKTGIRFDSSNDVLTSTSTVGDVYGLSAKTIFVAASHADQNSAANRWLLGDSAVDVVLYYNNNNMYFYHDDGGVDTALFTTWPGDLKPHVVTAWHDGTNITAQLDNKTAVSAASGATNSGAGTLQIGNSGGNPWGERIYEILIYNKVLGSADRAKVRKYLCDKWGANC